MPKAKREEQAKARLLFQQGKLTYEIAKELGVARASVSLWCRDLIHQNTTIAQAERVQTGLDVRIGIVKRNGQQILTDDQVVEMRRMVRADGFKGHAFYAEKYKTTLTSVRLALKGKTFKHVNAVEAPFTESFRGSPLKDTRQTEALKKLQEANKARRESLKKFMQEHNQFEREQSCL